VGRPKTETKHGTISAYVGHKCRCLECRRAWAKYHREYSLRNLTPTFDNRPRAYQGQQVTYDQYESMTSDPVMMAKAARGKVWCNIDQEYSDRFCEHEECYLRGWKKHQNFDHEARVYLVRQPPRLVGED